MSAISKYSNYAQFKNVDSKVNAMIQFDKSGTSGQIIGSDGTNGLVWVDSDPSSASYWSEYPATQNVDIADQNIDNVDTIELVNIIDSSGSSGTDTQLLSQNSVGALWIDQSDVIEKWSQYPATQTIDASGNDISDVNILYVNTLIKNDINRTSLDMVNNRLIFQSPSATEQTIYNYNNIFMQNFSSDEVLSININSININDQAGGFSNFVAAGISRMLSPTYRNTRYADSIIIEKLTTTQQSILNDSSLSLTDIASNNSLLTPTNLTFNSIPYNRNMINSTLVYSSALIYADGSAPATNLAIRNTYAYNGWYFKNTAPAGKKINWYFAPQQLNVTSVSDIKGLAVSFFNGATTSNDDTLFLTIYTIPTGSGDYAPGFFHSSMTYVFDQAVTPVANTNYQGIAICDLASIPFYYETQIAYEESTINNPKGTYLPTDKVLAVVIGSNSASAVNSVEFVVSKLNIIMDGFTQSLQLVPP